MWWYMSYVYFVLARESKRTPRDWADRTLLLYVENVNSLISRLIVTSIVSFI